MESVSFVLQKIRQMMLAKNWTFYALGKAANLPSATIKNWYSEKKQAEPSVQSLLQICDAFGITMSELWATGQVSELEGDKSKLIQEWEVLSPVRRKLVLKMILEYNHPEN